MVAQIDNKRIAKNTIMLFIRTLFVMFISLYTSRVILEALGVEDYGIYQVVGGMVMMFSIISSSLSTAISRFITFEIGSGDKERLKKIFSTSITIQIVIALIVTLLVEVIGIWFMDTEMQIPAERMNAARWVLHCSVLTFCINLLSVPYNACIIAHEHMSAFAYISILEAVIKLAICYAIMVSPIDKLIFYAILMLLLAVAIRIIYAVYCHRKFEESRAKNGFDKSIFKEMIGFSGWSFFNNSAFILNNQGINMLMNVYFGVVVNAARGIAVQVENSVLQFVNSFTTAINPQITKSYANGDLQGMHKLVCRGARFSYFMILFIALPIIIEAEQILCMWLVEVPEHAVAFVQLSLIMGMCDCIGNTGYTACIATGKLKKYSLIITSIACLEFPLAWGFFATGAAPEYAYITYIAVKTTILFVRMFLLKNLVELKISMYVNQVLIPITLTTIVAIIIPFVAHTTITPGILRFSATTVLSIICVSASVLYIGMSRDERSIVLKKCKSIISKFIKI